MALDTTKVRRARLPQPPTDGSPGMDDLRSAAPASRELRPVEVSDNTVPTDGRSLRATGRVVQLNLKTTPETKARFLALAKKRRMLMVDLFEQAIEALEQQEASR